MANKFKAILAGWVAIVFGTSILIYMVQPNTVKVFHTNVLINSLRGIWEVADEIAPLVKLSIVVIFGALVFIFSEFEKKKKSAFYFTNIIFALSAVILVLTFMPREYSRGYGIGLTGKRFDRDMYFIYLTGAVLGGIFYSYCFKKLSATK